MKEIKKEQLQYYCNSIGELHECGRRMLSSVDELPQQDSYNCSSVHTRSFGQASGVFAAILYFWINSPASSCALNMTMTIVKGTASLSSMMRSILCCSVTVRAWKSSPTK